jgi:soluble lytic murein transglycosylase
MALGGLSLACRSEPPSLAVESTSAPDEVGVVAPVPEPERSETGPWFDAGPGAEGMRLAARGDHAGAVEAFAKVVETPASEADRAMAQLLSGMSLQRLDRFEAAALAFAEARKDPSTAPLDAQVSVMQAQALLDAGQPQEAFDLVASMTKGRGVGAELDLVRADALARLDRKDEAVSAYRGYLAGAAGLRRQHEARAKLARLFEVMAADEAGDEAARKKHADEAARLWDKLSLDVPTSEYGKEASERLAEGAEDRLGRSKKERKTVALERELATLRAQLKRRRYKSVVIDAKALALKSGLSNAVKCELAYLEGSAVFKQRKRAASRAVFERAAPLCAKAGARELEVKSRYQGARGRYAEGQFTKAGRAFEALAKDHADHSYADDAWIKAGEAWESGGKRSAAANAYRQALARHPDGDMRHEARRRLLLMAFDEAQPEAAVKELEAFLAAKDVGADERATLHYFLGRAKARQAGQGGAGQNDYLEAIRLRPISYASVQSLSRLKEIGDAELALGLELLASETKSLPTLALPGSDPSGEARARLWARLGQGKRAWEALQELGIKGWPAVALLSEAQAWPEAQRRLADLGTAWRQQVPSSQTRAHWELAHPQPFSDLINRGEAEHGVPQLLTFAIMQTESRFDPDVTSWAGARGLVQLMPATAKDLASRAGITLEDGDLFRPDVNLDLGMRYLARLSARRGGTAAAASLAAPSYNAGAGAVDRWVKAAPERELDLFIEAIPYDETRKYAHSVMARWFAYRWLYGSGDPAERVPYLPLEIPAKR